MRFRPVLGLARSKECLALEKDLNSKAHLEKDLRSYKDIKKLTRNVRKEWREIASHI
jgi:hypothetical protein